MLLLSQKGFIIFPVSLMETQDSLVEGGLSFVKPLPAVATHIRAHFAVMGEYPLGDTPKAEPGGHVQPKYCITILQSVRERAAEVTVHDPLGLF